MHELSLCRMILEIVNKQASERKCQQITRISLELGQLAAVDEQVLKFCFGVAAAGTLAEHAILDIIPIEGKAICDFCQKTVRLKNYYDGCDSCGRFSLQVIEGEALRVKSME